MTRPTTMRAKIAQNKSNKLNFIKVLSAITIPLRKYITSRLVHRTSRVGVRQYLLEV